MLVQLGVPWEFHSNGIMGDVSNFGGAVMNLPNILLINETNAYRVAAGLRAFKEHVSLRVKLTDITSAVAV